MSYVLETAINKTEHGVRLLDFVHQVFGKLEVTLDSNTQISGVPQGTVLGPLLFLILFIDIGVLNAKVVSFADDTRLYSKISYVEDCDLLQSDLNCVYN